MQNPYAVERFIQQHDAHAQAEAELLALRRQAISAQRGEVRAAWWERLTRLVGRPAGAGGSCEGTGP